MPWLIVTDEETLDLMDAAAEMASAAMAARSRRVDQDDVIKRSLDMSRIKLQDLRSAFNTRPLTSFSELEPVDRLAVDKLMHAFIASEDGEELDGLWQVLRGFMLRPGKKEPAARGANTWSNDDLPQPAVSLGAGKPAEKPARMRKVPRQSLD